ncbi:MAG: fatty acid desaturase [Pseudomonadota bacterium]
MSSTSSANPQTAASSQHDWALLRQTLPFRRANAWLSAWQVVSTLMLAVATLALVARYPSWWLQLLLVLPMGGLLIRLFVLQHDCGHGSLFNQRSINQFVGHLLAAVTTVPFKLWAAEHHWHHQNQGKLEHRGVDMMNSPMTLQEAHANPRGRRYREDKISVRNIFAIGAWSLLAERKFSKDFFMFRKAFRWPVPQERALRRSIVIANVSSLLVHGAILWWIGWVAYLTFMLPASFIGAGCGSLLFWIQHNFEETYYAPVTEWQYNKVGTQGSSYLRLPPLLAWFTAHIGLHHVHHLNASIPNYRLEEARLGIAELTAVQPMTHAQYRGCFSKLFWDARTSRLSSYRVDDAA